MRPDVVADVMIETEHAVWTLVSGDDLPRRIERDPATADFAALLLDATSWSAGTRDCLLGVLSSHAAHQDPESALVERPSGRVSNLFDDRHSIESRQPTGANRMGCERVPRARTGASAPGAKLRQPLAADSASGAADTFG